MNETQNPTNFEFFKKVMSDRLNWIEGDDSFKRREASEILALYLENFLHVVDQDEHDIWPAQSQKDAYIVECTRAYMEAYQEYIKEIRKY
ncbi:hypothetical protein [Saccharibacillus brassicae]|uniref:Uncharacterized protein n=1 Tax=Saccharibacillus brassicae TaxID=2583377 RepID=A0A4Y6V241_SACBS|nr:hypothetical protein [Saccharibacillus brassicae]QDH23434.1 hypothetical protein FFV09_22750 [Saccharibacillus brassicae]